MLTGYRADLNGKSSIIEVFAPERRLPGHQFLATDLSPTFWNTGNIRWDLPTIWKTNKTTLWPFFMDGVQLSQSHYKKTVYFLPLSPLRIQVILICWIKVGYDLFTQFGSCRKIVHFHIASRRETKKIDTWVSFYKQSLFLYFSVFIFHLYFLLGS